MFLLLFSIYYYARCYYSHGKAILVLMIYAVVYPISIRYYAGQITDPISHLSFVLTFIFLKINLFSYFSLTILIGILAKESIGIMSLYYVLFRRKDKRYLFKVIFLIVICFFIIFGIRMWVTSGDVQYRNISGVNLTHVKNNLLDISRWGRQMLFTVGIFIPFLFISWKGSQREIRNLTIFLFPFLLLSNVFFGWLCETRNLIPVVIILSLIAVNSIPDQFRIGRNKITSF